MSHPHRPIAFVLAASNHGPMIVNRNDFHARSKTDVVGVGHQILSKSCFDPTEVDFVLAVLTLRRRFFGDGVVAIDGGANIGVHAVEWGRHMHGWGSAYAFEAQEAVFYALAGNLALNNCLNVHARLTALGESPGELDIPVPDYYSPGCFGSLELRPNESVEYIGQSVSYDAAACTRVPMTSVDALGLKRLDLMKLDVEGMELDVLRGAHRTLSAHHPFLLVETVKSGREAVGSLLQDIGYTLFHLGMNTYAVHQSDPTLARLKHHEKGLSLAL